ncbi:MAG: spore cortex biosynthesis protein YabQ [Firmicutes bacterium]|nr:spore cortex biosynthesis protein YabQ [Bacillota bacterium]
MTDEAVSLFLIFALGAVCACLYDLFRAFHILLKKRAAAVIISDVVYWIAVTQGIIYFLWKINGVAIQLYEIAGLFLGAALYFLTLSRYIYRIFSVIVIKTAKIMRYILKIVGLQ